MQSPISNNCFIFHVDGKPENQLVPKLLLQVPVREVHNIMVIPTEEDGINEVIYKHNKTITSDSVPCTIIPHQQNNISESHKVMCGCESCIYAKSMHLFLLK